MSDFTREKEKKQPTDAPSIEVNETGLYIRRIVVNT